ncbi:periplasmic or secreted lipoprotein [Achromatium sp. WMS3]|nr:periplasmic or secreted lipoprotein [Achromatium sp. WMS3]
MTNLPQISSRQIVNALKKIGYEKDQQRGSHIVLRQIYEPHRRQVVPPDHKIVAKGTLRSIIKQCGLTVEGFVNIL